MCVLLSCTSTPYTEHLQHIETIIESNPDSALAMLQTIDRNSLTNDRDKALYGMLYTESLDKNHEPIPDDSLIGFAAQYFSDHNDKRRSMIALNYKGRAQYLNQNHPSALVSFIKANELAKELSDPFWTGMTARGIADIYQESFNTAEAIIYATEEYNNIMQSRRQPYINYSILDLASAYCSAGNYDKALTLSKQALDSAQIYDDVYLYTSAQQIISIAHIGNHDLTQGQNVLESLCQSNLAEVNDSLYLAWIYAATDKPQKAIQIYNEISDSTDGRYHIAKYKTLKKLSLYEAALLEFEKVDSLTNLTFKTRINQNLTGSMVETFDADKQKAHIQLQSAYTKTWFIIISSSCIIITLLICGIYVYDKQRKKIEAKVLFAEELQELLSQSESKNSEAIATIKYILASKYTFLEDLCSIVLRYNNLHSAKQKIADSVTTLLENLSIQSERIVLLEKHVDKIYNNVFTSFRQDFPSLKDNDYRLFLFIILGLSNAAISLLLKEEKLSAIYERKRRLKEKIKNLPQEKQEMYMFFFVQ